MLCRSSVDSTEMLMAFQISKMIQKKFWTIDFQELISMAYIFVKEQEEKYPDKKDAGLVFVNAKGKLFKYCVIDLKHQSYFEPIENDEVEDLKEASYKKELEEKIMKIDMQHNLSSDALFTIDRILDGKFLTKLTEEELPYAKRLSKKATIIENLKKEGWKRARAKKTIEEISCWWEDYFNVKSKKNTFRKEGEIITYYENGKAYKKIKKNGKIINLNRGCYGN